MNDDDIMPIDITGGGRASGSGTTARTPDNRRNTGGSTSNTPGSAGKSRQTGQEVTIKLTDNKRCEHCTKKGHAQCVLLTFEGNKWRCQACKNDKVQNCRPKLTEEQIKSNSKKALLWAKDMAGESVFGGGSVFGGPSGRGRTQDFDVGSDREMVKAMGAAREIWEIADGVFKRTKENDTKSDMRAIKAYAEGISGDFPTSSGPGGP